MNKANIYFLNLNIYIKIYSDSVIIENYILIKYKFCIKYIFHTNDRFNFRSESSSPTRNKFLHKVY